MQLVQKKRAFAFGTAVSASYMTDPLQKTYQDFVYNNFEWAVLENALKWRQMEWTEVRLCIFISLLNNITRITYENVHLHSKSASK